MNEVSSSATTLMNKENTKKRNKCSMHTDPLGRKHSEVLEYISCSNVDRRSVFPVRRSFVPFPLRWARSPSKANDQGTIQWAQHKLLLLKKKQALFSLERSPN
jgi:hypothetical protein